ncbi:sensor domain-containing protein [Tuwongella immobilis]|uniref:Uncharacterized protein n=1 Tax=Tuwongella immobilis TaxID=692036 RepID=A0A6C2YLI9_9BACT|nr:PAS domain S-box protein [Tuwongella immobilis]VIP02244.1 pas domain s-box diguanylate cyclase domain-containing protein : Diguanylate cyclase/phosphodiesterase with PAS/PAC sensor(S) OS=Methylomicrobium alcaliphilum (strain DSM 19304 / NCIMB 14124 / VKM B-2133 / 20Z) GN=MEALZ_3723 PE=4 SV=1: PAS_4: PAS_9: PAS_9: PAS_9: GGDEF: EAL [Tuwongella immobilis]VTS00819.1 pas domain s-box diguanylate cyclase domain-containing protein : Diguanylate cyclase/phosphodiesterase with PAS/PAC sensor(S) OS=Met
MSAPLQPESIWETGVERTTPLRIASIYFGFGLVWILATDMAIWGSDEAHFSEFVAAVGKGVLFVFISACLIFLLLQRAIYRVIRVVQLLRAVIDGTHDAIFLKDLQGRYVLCNSATLKMLGQSESEVLGKTAKDLFHPDSARRLEEHDRFVIQLNEPETTEEHLQFQVAKRVLLTTKAPYRDLNGQVLGVVGIARDITTRKEMELELRRMTTWLQEVSELAHVGGWEYDVRAQMGTWTSESARIFGSSDPEFSRESVERCFTPEDFELLQSTFVKHLNRVGSCEIEFPITNRNGQRRWIRVIGKPVWEHGELHRFRGSLQDITARREDEERIRQLSVAVEQSPATIVITDAQGTIQYANPAFTRVTGYRAEEVLGQNPRILKSGQMSAEFYREMWSTLTAGVVWRGEILNRKKDGSLYWEAASISPLHNDAGVTTHYVAVKEDITARKQIEASLRRSEEQFRAFMEHSPTAAWICDAQGHLEFLSSTCSRILPMIAEPTPGATIQGIFPREIAAMLSSPELANQPTGSVKTTTVSIRQEPDSVREIMVVQFPLPRPDHGIAMGGIAADITELRLAEERLRVLGAAIDSSPNAVFIADRGGIIRWANPAFTQLSGYELAEIVGHTPRILKSGRQTENFYQALWQSILTGRVWTGEIVERHKSGREYIVRQTITPLAGPDGTVAQFVAVQEDITANKQAEAKLRDLVVTDTLTNLLNRSGFRDRLSQSLHSGTHALHFIDLDRFKLVNDALGHLAGDELLRQVAERLRLRIRADDVAARLGGDEFAILQPNVTDPLAASGLAQGILETLSRPFDIFGDEVRIGCSIGITFYPQDGTSSEVLLKNADLAMYQAKQSGRGTFRFFTIELEREVQARIALETELRRALERQEFTLLFQPQVDLVRGELIAAESLLRWQHPVRGLIGPGAFLTVAEESGLILPIGEWVLRAACRQARAWLDANCPIRVAVNISVAQFQRSDLAVLVASILQETQLPPEYLELELTESLLLPDVPESERLIAALSKLGVKLAIDDFGTGYSSLSYLRRLPVDRLKIDRSFVSGLPDNPRDATLVRAITGLGHDLHLRVIAEGIETAEQCRFLRSCGCDEGQGFWFGRPLEAEKIHTAVQNLPPRQPIG